MRCPDCNKFVSYDEPQCEVSSVDVDGETVRAQVIVQLNCQDCGTTLKEAEIESEEEIMHECIPESERDKDFVPCGEDDDQFELVDEGCPDSTSRTDTTDRNGKPIKNARYAKSYYGFTLDSEIKCLKCGETFHLTFDGEEQASSFNECC